jgi:hypothetical protein
MQNAQKTHGNRSIQRVYGQRPTGDVPGWYGFNYENKQGGYNWGGGYGHSASETGEWWQRMGGDLPFANGNFLMWGENDDKDTRYGAKAEVGAGRLEYKGDGWSADANAFGVNGEASVGTNGATFGGGATIVGGSATVGKFDPKSNTDTQTRFGLSAGPSFGLRGHWGDSDNDGHREIGAGFDLGIFSADLKSEDPLRSAMNLIPGPASGVNQALSGINDENGPNSLNKALGGQYLPSLEDNKTNLTEKSLGWASGSDKPVTIDNAFKAAWPMFRQKIKFGRGEPFVPTGDEVSSFEVPDLGKPSMPSDVSDGGLSVPNLLDFSF